MNGVAGNPGGRASAHTGRRAALLLLPAVLLTGCSEEGEQAPATPSAAPNIIQPGAPGEENTRLTAVPEMEVPEHTDADVAFVKMMLQHHAQALEMTALVADRTEREDIPLLAERMDISQRDEIALMRQWLADRGEVLLDTGHQHGGDPMPGLLTQAQLEELEAASGAEFDRLFLELMTYHHEGALVMVQDLWADGGGQEPQLYLWMTHIESDQRIEIGRMRRLLAELD